MLNGSFLFLSSFKSWLDVEFFWTTLGDWFFWFTLLIALINIRVLDWSCITRMTPNQPWQVSTLNFIHHLFSIYMFVQVCTHRCTHDTEHMCRPGKTFEVVLHLVPRQSLSSLVLVSSPLPASRPAIGCWPSYRWAPPHLEAFNFHLLFVLCMLVFGLNVCLCILCVPSAVEARRGLQNPRNWS